MQDSGVRGLRAWEAAAIEQGEAAGKVVAVEREALSPRPWTQLVTDPGTPYLAEEAQRAYEEMGLGPAPQKGAYPQAKATLERSLRSVEHPLKPLVLLGNNSCRCYASLCDRYFAGILRNVARESGVLRAQRRGEPEEGLVAGLERIAEQWDAVAGGFVLGRNDPFRAVLRAACTHLADPRSALDRAEVAWTR